MAAEVIDLTAEDQDVAGYDEVKQLQLQQQPHQQWQQVVRTTTILVQDSDSDSDDQECCQAEDGDSDVEWEVEIVGERAGPGPSSTRAGASTQTVIVIDLTTGVDSDSDEGGGEGGAGGAASSATSPFRPQGPPQLHGKQAMRAAAAVAASRFGRRRAAARILQARKAAVAAAARTGPRKRLEIQQQRQHHTQQQQQQGRVSAALPDTTACSVVQLFVDGSHRPALPNTLSLSAGVWNAECELLRGSFLLAGGPRDSVCAELGALLCGARMLRDVLAAKLMQPMPAAAEVLCDCQVAIKYLQPGAPPCKSKYAAMVAAVRAMLQEVRRLLPVKVRWVKGHCSDKTPEAAGNKQAHNMAKNANMHSAVLQLPKPHT